MSVFITIGLDKYQDFINVAFQPSIQQFLFINCYVFEFLNILLLYFPGQEVGEEERACQSNDSDGDCCQVSIAGNESIRRRIILKSS